MKAQIEVLRTDALECLLEGIRAVEPSTLVAERLRRLDTGSGMVHVAAIGKAAGTMAAGAHSVLGDRMAGGVVIAPELVDVPVLPGVEVFRGGHPVPNEAGMRGAAEIREMAAALDANDLLLCLISGGGSALMALPPEGVSLADLQTTTDLLLRAGATIQELNCVRKHLDRLKGGGLATVASPARVIGLVLSDVCGDPLDVIASGPLSPDPTTFDTAVHVLTSRGLWEVLPEAVRDHLEAGLEGDVAETPAEDDPVFERVDVHIVGNNRIAAEAVRRQAERRGYRTLLLSTEVTGEAREVGRVFGAIAREIRTSGEPIAPPACVIAAGETTVTVRGDGRGGRNQELALGAAFVLRGMHGVVVGSIGTDGIDGPTDAAGALVDGTTVARALEQGIDTAETLSRNDAYALLQAVDGLISTGPTGTNVMDLQIVIVGDS